MGVTRRRKIVLMGDERDHWANVNLHLVMDQMRAIDETDDIRNLFDGHRTPLRRNGSVSGADMLVVFLGGSEKGDVAIEMGMHMERQILRVPHIPLVVLIPPYAKIPPYVKSRFRGIDLTVYVLQRDIKKIVEEIILKTKLR